MSDESDVDNADVPPVAEKPTAKEEVEWKFSDARQIMLQALDDGVVPLEYGTTIGPRAAYDILINEGLEDTEYNDLFTRRLRDLAGQVVGNADRANDDEHAYQNFMRNHPKRAFDSYGRPRWEGSEAERLLKEDMANGIHQNYKGNPMQFYHTRGEYQKFTLEVFRAHIDQEIRLQNYLSFLRDKEAALQEKRLKAKEAVAAKKKKAADKAAAVEKKAADKAAAVEKKAAKEAHKKKKKAQPKGKAVLL